jgi:hypothetical protein
MTLESDKLAAAVAQSEAKNPPARFATREAAERIAAYYVGRNNAQREPDDPYHVYRVEPQGAHYVIAGELRFYDEEITTITRMGHLNEEAVINAEYALAEDD